MDTTLKSRARRKVIYVFNSVRSDPVLLGLGRFLRFLLFWFVFSFLVCSGGLDLWLAILVGCILASLCSRKKVEKPLHERIDPQTWKLARAKGFDLENTLELYNLRQHGFNPQETVDLLADVKRLAKKFPHEKKEPLFGGKGSINPDPPYWDEFTQLYPHEPWNGSKYQDYVEAKRYEEWLKKRDAFIKLHPGEPFDEDKFLDYLEELRGRKFFEE